MISGQNNVVDNFIKDLVREAEEYARASTPEHKEAIKKKVKSFLKQGISIHTKNTYNYNAANFLGRWYKKEACLFLWEQGANYLDFIKGIFSNKDKDPLPFVEEIINNMPKDLIIDYHEIAVLAARYGHQEAAENYLAKMPSSQHPDYYWLALNGAAGGHQPVAEYFLSKTKASQKIDYNDLAASAARNGHQLIADYFLSKITPPAKPDYDRIIKSAEKGHNIAVAQHFTALALAKKEAQQVVHNMVDTFISCLVRCAKDYALASTPQSKRNIELAIESFLQANLSIHAKDKNNLNAAMYLGMENNKPAWLFLESKGARLADFIEGAFKGNHLALVNDLLDNVPNNLEVNYNLIAALAAKYGYQQWAENFLSKIKSPQRPDYMMVAKFAAAGGHQILADHFLSKLPTVEKPDYDILATAAAERGHQQVADYFLGKIAAPEKPNYNMVAVSAVLGGHLQLATYYLDKIAPPDKANYRLMSIDAKLRGHVEMASYFLAKHRAEQDLKENTAAAASGLLAFSAEPVIHTTNQATLFSSENAPLRDISNTIASNDNQRVKAKDTPLDSESLQKQIEAEKSKLTKLHKLLEEENNNEESTTVMCSSKSVTPVAQSKRKSSKKKAPSDNAPFSIYANSRRAKFK
ncbi:MAG: hypothetical protein JSR17_03665 [Proteobacteria bacterium]|nr:hypothetical protein [Pseudomonadota bacterium]